jgi:glutathione S-transferase-like protein
VKLYICWGTFRSPRPGGHPCRNAHEALKKAGHEHEVVHTYGVGPLGPLNVTRRVVHEKTGQWWVPVLELDDGEVIVDAKAIAAWAEENPPSSVAR